MTLRKADATGAKVFVRAGTDTAEWAIERGDVANVIAHGSPRKREAFPAEGFSGYWFETEIPLTANGSAVVIDELSLDWKLDATPVMAIRTLELIDRTKGVRVAVNGADFVFDGAEGWMSNPALPGIAWLRRNDTASRAWSVAAVRALGPAASVAALRSGALDGKPLDMRAMALIDLSGNLPSTEHVLAQGAVTVREWERGRVRLGIQAPAETFVVVSQTFYPGWHAEIDGIPAKLLRTDVLLQGLFVPAGNHEVVLSFHSASLMIGATVSAGALLTLIVIVIVGRRKRRQLECVADQPASGGKQ